VMVQDNPLLRLRALGQSIWLDYLRRGMIVSGELKRLVEEDIDLNAVTQQLEDEGIEKFDKAFDGLMEALKRESAA
jgi:transaldolase